MCKAVLILMAHLNVVFSTTTYSVCAMGGMYVCIVVIIDGSMVSSPGHYFILGVQGTCNKQGNRTQGCTVVTNIMGEPAALVVSRGVLRRAATVLETARNQAFAFLFASQSYVDVIEPKQFHEKQQYFSDCLIPGRPPTMQLHPFKDTTYCSFDFMAEFTRRMRGLLHIGEEHNKLLGTLTRTTDNLRVAVLHAPFAYNSNIILNLVLRFSGRYKKRIFLYRAKTPSKFLRSIDRFQFQIYQQRWPADAKYSHDVWIQPVVPGWYAALQ